MILNDFGLKLINSTTLKRFIYLKWILKTFSTILQDFIWNMNKNNYIYIFNHVWGSRNVYFLECSTLLETRSPCGPTRWRAIRRSKLSTHSQTNLINLYPGTFSTKMIRTMLALTPILCHLCEQKLARRKCSERYATFVTSYFSTDKDPLMVLQR